MSIMPLQTVCEKVLLQQQKNEIEETISIAQMEHIKLCAQENEISLTELDDILQPIIDSCTKDSIANGRWFELHI
jgi:calcium homeostasis ER protein